ncbi:MAG: ArsR/SmtB family transcription factor [Candidatus Heimdallarchaeaceae archaeon]|jgi:predicted transcriptional regulator|nr:ArsR family transcriptional regulator [Candidatus Heimdallarchaeota archaeon]MCK4252919.1 ArsR family transcriptional regulator [Candidatus Heimdallarchaeota archaeon]
MTEILELSDEENIIKLAKALSSPTRYKIVKLLLDKEMDISSIAKRMKQTEANTSAQIKYLEKAGVLDSRYEPGAHGVRKVCKTRVNKIILNIV